LAVTTAKSNEPDPPSVALSDAVTTKPEITVDAMEPVQSNKKRKREPLPISPKLGYVKLRMALR